MKVETPYGTVDLRWAYTPYVNHPRGVTHCKLSVHPHPEDAYPPDSAEALAICHEDDRVNKATGRKIALARALQSLSPPYRENYRFRRAVWDGVWQAGVRRA